MHPIARVLTEAAAGRYPPSDGAWERVDTWRAGVAGVVAFTGHAYLALTPDVELPPRIVELVDGYGGAHHPRVAAAIAGPDGWIDVLDGLLVAHGRGSAGELVERPDLADHPRAAFARRLRDDVRCVGLPTGRSLVTIGRGIGGLVELGVEVDPADGVSGRRLVGGALDVLPAGELVVAAVAPGNARAQRAFLAAGFTPVGSVQVILPA